MKKIDRTSPEPYYMQLTRILEEEINSGVYKTGDRFPGETKLCRLYDLSRSTVRQTLRTLAQDRKIHMVPRRGAFVSDLSDSHWNLQVPQGFLEPEAHSPEHSIDTTVLRATFEPLSHFATSALSLNSGETGFVIERIRAIDGIAAIYSINYMPMDVGNALIGKPVLQGLESLNETLRNAGFTIHSARREVSAINASAEVSKNLKLPSGSPVALIQSVSRNENQRAFDFYQSYVRTDVVTIAIDATNGQNVN